MGIARDAIVIALTGPFGSGCSTAAQILSDHAGYKALRLSELIVKEWRRLHGRKRPKRGDLQALGNSIRRDVQDPGALAHMAIESLEAGDGEIAHIVIDGIRNVGEIETLRERFGHNFYLVALECPTSERFERLAAIYKGGEKGLAQFTRDNEADRDQENSFGQQVALCVDLADVLVINNNDVTLTSLRKKLLEYVNVITGEKPRYATATETLMNFAYSAAHGSKCLKRQVGAVIVAAPPGAMGDVIGQGFNENPRPTLPCVEEPKYGADMTHLIPGRCYRDIVRHESLAGLSREKVKCPSCGARMETPSEDPPWECSRCGVNLETYFWPERAMTFCTAIHAEVAALLAAGREAHGATLYTTTYPCFQCAEKITQVGISAIVFTEPYPDVRAAERLDIAGIDTIRFEGVRSGRFDEIFSRARPYISEQRRATRERRKKHH